MLLPHFVCLLVSRMSQKLGTDLYGTWWKGLSSGKGEPIRFSHRLAKVRRGNGRGLPSKAMYLFIRLTKNNERLWKAWSCGKDDLIHFSHQLDKRGMAGGLINFWCIANMWDQHILTVA